MVKPKFISTGVESLDKFLLGGIPLSKPSLIYGEKNIGKSIFSLQESVICANELKLPVLYIDTELMWSGATFDLWYSYFKKRWNLPSKLPIEFEFIPSLFKLGKFFGMEYQVGATEKRQEVLVKFPRRSPSKGEYTKSSIQSEDWLERSPIWKRLSEKQYGLLVVDSITRPLKSVISKSTQNLPARGSALDPLLSAFLDIAAYKNMAVLVTNHIVKSPMDRHPYGIPWGGADVEYFIKHILGIIYPLKAMLMKHGAFKGRKDIAQADIEPRIINRHRYPGLLEEMMIVLLKKDCGYIDVPSFREGK